jgi:hypothetical protein
MARVTWVRVSRGPEGTRCHVAGVAHRRPVLRRVPLRTATALLAAGVPGLVRSTVLHGAEPVAAGAGESR